ncbi:UNVERIFIED_CONTAM: Pentatricopeptide repeat-containing protein, chloroplastic [Sesamum angustifolium]|uniref:Pentatricopeptide repeat-containing protein, chloroplastic n=1 Tax=Sesamum angustifolium TaxID=2727405 RepID=A0AAW2QV60_9LAMI
MYARCNNINAAEFLFARSGRRDVVLWNLMISAYVTTGMRKEALRVFEEMQNPLLVTSFRLRCALQACEELFRNGNHSLIREPCGMIEIHAFALKNGMELDLQERCLHLGESIASSLVDMYASCGAVDNSYKVFNSTRDKDLVLWTSMINAYGMHGQGVTAIELFRQMEAENLRPDHIAFLALLYACSHSSLVDAGKRYFNIMQCQYDLEPWPEHYACLVDLLGRANCLEEAFELVKSMKLEPTAAVWCALLGACRTHSNLEIGENSSKKAS